MAAFSPVRAMLFLGAVVAIAGCAPDLKGWCTTSADCPEGTQCIDNLCIQEDPVTITDGGLPRDAGSPIDAGQPVDGGAVACRSSADCGDPNKVCTIHNECVWAPGKCGTDTDCNSPMTPVCDTARESCVQCVSSSQCPSGQQCQNDTCVATSNRCRNDRQCGGDTPHCDTQSGACVQCTASSQCSGGAQCTNNVCTVPPGGCRTDADCTDPTARFCETSSARCVSCLLTEQCGPGQTCQRNVCTGNAGACSHDADCRGLMCVPQANSRSSTWVNQCQVGTFFNGNSGGAACQSAQDCASGVCHVPYANAPEGICIDACTSDSDCADGAQCPPDGVSLYLPASGGMQALATAAICWPRSCGRDDDCQGLGMNGDDWACALRPDPLRPTTDLVESCSPPLGSGRGGQPCNSGNDCFSGWCQQWDDPQRGTTVHECFEACEQDSDCPTGIHCYTGLQLLGNEVGRLNTCAAF